MLADPGAKQLGAAVLINAPGQWYLIRFFEAEGQQMRATPYHNTSSRYSSSSLFPSPHANIATPSVAPLTRPRPCCMTSPVQYRRIQSVLCAFSRSPVPGSTLLSLPSLSPSGPREPRRPPTSLACPCSRLSLGLCSCIQRGSRHLALQNPIVPQRVRGFFLYTGPCWRCCPLPCVSDL